MSFDNTEVQETKYVVTWYYNERQCFRVLDTLAQVEILRDKLIYQDGYNPQQIGVHLKQINKFGDPTTV